MPDSQDNQGQEGLEQQDVAGNSGDVATGETGGAAPGVEDDLPQGIKARLGRQEKKHQAQMRDMQARLDALSAHVGSQQGQQPMQQDPAQQQQSQAPMQIQPGSDQERMFQAAFAAHQAHAAEQQRQAQAQKQQEMQAQNSQYEAQQIQSLHERMSKDAEEKYDDFDEVVKDPQKPFTTAMHNYAMTLTNPTDVLYSLGKNPDELKRVSQLHPLEQMKEMSKLSAALLLKSNGGAQKMEQTQPISQIKSSPVVNAKTTYDDNTPFSVLKERAKAGWK